VDTVNGGAQTTLLLDDRGITTDATFDVAAGLLTTYTPIASTYYVENAFVRRQTATLIAGPDGPPETDNSAVGIYYSHLAELDVYDGAASTTAPKFNHFLVYRTKEVALVSLRAHAPDDDIELGGVHNQIAVLPIADGGLSRGIANIRDVRGSQGGNTLTGNSLGNILIGGAGANTIVGGSGRSILIGGNGIDTVTGGSGNDIIIAGYTDYDASSLAHDQALDSILAEWQSGNPYSTRISNIKNGSGLNGSNNFAWGITVLDNSASSANKLTGAGEPGAQNWFFANLSHTTTNKSDGEQLN
jgi:hypothetical protein